MRFWQASDDHRGTPDFPGRVATIVPEPGATVWGRVYRLRGDREAVLAYLDHREKCGYERHSLRVTSGSAGTLRAISYVGSPHLPSFVGPEEEEVTASVIGRARGPSGENIDYLRKLHHHLSRIGRMEPHVERLLRLVESFPHASRSRCGEVWGERR